MAKASAETASTELVDVEKSTAIKAFNDRKAFDQMLADIRKAVAAAKPDGLDMNLKKDRDTLRSLAAKIPKVKTRIDAWGASEVEDLRKKVSDMDAMRKEFKDDLDDLRDEIRKPLTDWEEAEEKRKSDIREQIEAARNLGQVKFGETSAQIQERIENLPKHDLDWYGEFKDEAKLVIDTAFDNLTTAKTIAKNAEDEAERREQEKAELDALRRKSEEADRIAGIRAKIAAIISIGNGILNDEPAETAVLIKALNSIRIDPSFGEFFNEASDAKDKAIEKLNDRMSREAEERAKRLADEEAQRVRDEEVAEANRRAEEAERRAKELEAEAQQKAAADQAAAETVAVQEEAHTREIEQNRVAEHMREATAGEVRDRNMAETRDDIEAILSDRAIKRADAPGAVLAAVIKGKIRHVIFQG